MKYINHYLKLKSLTKYFVIACSLLVISGCFELDQTLEIKPNGSAIYTVNSAMNSRILLFGPDPKDPQLLCESLSEAPHTLTITSKGYYKDGDLKCDQVVEGDIQDLNELMVSRSNAMQDSIDSIEKSFASLFDDEETPAEEEPEIIFQPALQIEKISENTYKIISQFPAVDNSDDSLAGTPLEEALQKQMEILYAGRFYKFTVIAPKIITSNGTIADNEKSAFIEFPIAQITETGVYFETVIELETSWLDSIYKIFD